MARIIQQNILDSYTKDSLRYAMEVNRQRAIPDRKDGLKLVARRIIDTMLYEESECLRGAVKSAAIVGKTLAKSHPHGDTSVYDAMKPMVNWFQIKYPLIQGEGNWGTLQGKSHAAMRYTAAGLSDFCVDVMINDLQYSKAIIDWKNTFDDKHIEPEYLPAALPVLLIQGSFGIGYGIKIEIPKHNLAEVIDATLNLIKNPNSEVVLIPDHCMPVHVFDTNWKSICNTGHGEYKVRGLIDIEERKGKHHLIIKSTPDAVTLVSVLQIINDLISKKQILQISDMYAEDAKQGEAMRYSIELKKGSDPNYVREMIYKKTQMEKSYTINFEALDGIDLDRLSYKAYLQSFIEFRKITKFRLYCNRLQIVETKLHEKDTYITLLQSGRIDEIITKIRNAKESDDENLTDWLVRELKITPLQSKYVLNVNIKQLSMGYLNKYIKERDGLLVEKQNYLDIITDDNKILNLIVEELKYYRKKYGRPRTSLVIDPKDISEVPAGDFKIIITENNYIKKVPASMGIGFFKQDEPKIVIKGDNRESLLIFDEQGKVFNLPISKIPISDKNSNGIDIRLLIKKLTSNINTVVYEPLLKDLSKKIQKYFLTIVTTNGNIKKLDLEDFVNVPPSGILAIKMDDNDTVKAVKIIHNSLDIIVYSNDKALRMPLNDVPHQKRNTKGMRAMSVDNPIDGIALITPDTTDVVVITEQGKVNRFNVSGLPVLGRNKAGSKVIKLSNGDVIKSVLSVNEHNVITVICKSGRIDLAVKDIECSSSISQGKKLIPLKNDNIIRIEVKKID